MRNLVLKGMLFTIGLFLVLELFFRFALPASEWPRGVILESGIRRFDNEHFTSGKFSYGRYCRGGFSWSINNRGWNSIYNYEPISLRKKPMVAILGDSYIEGFYSNVDEHIDVYLTEMFEDSVCFYSFGMSGGILSQYIALMRYEIEQYSPDAYLVFVNASDISRSIREIGGTHPYYFQYSMGSSKIYSEVAPSAQSRSFLKDIVLGSAFVRYLRANAQLSIFTGGLSDENANQEEVDGDIACIADVSIKLGDAGEFLLDQLNSFDRPVVIVADCPRNWIYENGTEEAFEDVLALRNFADDFPNVFVLELSDYYVSDYATRKQRFSVSGNPHWNSATNKFISQVLFAEVNRILITVEQFSK